jgi:hypothetical protein
MDTASTTGSSEMVFVHDDEGNDYVLPRATLNYGHVPAEMKSEITNLVDPETSGYWTTSGKVLYQELIPYFGLLLIDKEGNPNDISKTQLSFGQTVGGCDYNQNHVIDIVDMQKVQNF